MACLGISTGVPAAAQNAVTDSNDGSLGPARVASLSAIAFPDLPLPAGSPAAAAVATPAAATALPEAPSALVRDLFSGDPASAPSAGPTLHLPLPRLSASMAETESSSSAQAIPPAPQPGAIDLTLDQAIANAVKSNLRVQLSTLQEQGVHGEVLTVGNVLLPNLQAQAYSKAQEIDLAALGFKQSTLASIKIPGFNTSNFSTIVKLKTTSAEFSLSQVLFNVPAYFLFRSAQRAVDAAQWSTGDAKGAAVAGVGGLYLRALADAAEVRDAQALIQQDQVVYDHAKAAQDAGTGIHLDVLRAQTDLRTEQQRLLQAENAVAKDKIMLNRVMGAPAGQAINLVDTVPFAELTEQTLDEQLALAYERRKDLRGLESQLAVAEEAQRAVKYERLPTLSAGGFYGVIGVTDTGKYHGNFVAQFKLSMPVFLEAELRGQREVGNAQITALRNQIAARKAQIEADLRDSRLDLESSKQLVLVSRSNVVLAQQALDDATLRFTSGVADNLPVAQAQAALVGAEAQVIQAEFQYNYAKLTLARRLGVVQTEYNRYLGK